MLTVGRVYLLEGLYTVLLAVVVYIVLPDYPKSPRTSKWLNAREQEYLEVRLSENAPLTHEDMFAKAEVVKSLRDPRTYAVSLVYQHVALFSDLTLTRTP